MRYIIKKGDTLYKLANRYGITLNALMIANPELEQGQILFPGQIIDIPQAVLNQYMVQKGDTLYLIAEKFSLSINQLLKANQQIKDPNQIKVGEVIWIPRLISTDIVQTNQEYTYQDFEDDLLELQQKYTFINREIIGSSVMGKNIYAIRLGIGQKEVFYSGNWHANEYLTGPLLMKFIEDYAKAYEEKTLLRGYDVDYLFNNTSIWIVPMVNPDGIDLVFEGITPDHPYYSFVLNVNNGSKDFSYWTANIRGVDLNHQWPANWEMENERSPQLPSPRKYGGPYPLSEPETVAIYNFTQNHNFRMVLAFHSQGQVIYWGYEDLEPEESEDIVNRFAVLTGYTPEKGAYSAAGYKDWFIQEYRRPGFTIEVGTGTNPLPISQFQTIYRNNLSLLLEAPLL